MRGSDLASSYATILDPPNRCWFNVMIEEIHPKLQMRPSQGTYFFFNFQFLNYKSNISFV